MAEPLGPGSVIEGRFRIERALGAGGMGVVYLARHLALGRDVALKLHRSGAGSRATQRLSREAQAMARLSHPNVLTVFDVGSLASGSVFIAMEYVDGPTLRGRQDQLRQAGDWAGIIDLYRESAKGLAAAHAKGLVHRDFKPDNVLIGTDGRVRVADFGIARALDAGDDGVPAVARTVAPTVSDLGTPMTATGALLGTPAYMAPEQYGSGPVEAQADQFAFCVALYEGLFGSRPFPGNNPGELYYNISQGNMIVPQLGAVPASVYETIRRGLALDPHQRFASIEQLADALVPVQVEAAPTPKPTKSKAPLVIGLVVGVGVLAGVGIVLSGLVKGGKDEAAAAGEASEPAQGESPPVTSAAPIITTRWEAPPEGDARFETPAVPLAPALPAKAVVTETITCEGRESMTLRDNRITPRDGRAVVAQGQCHLVFDGATLDGIIEVRGDARVELRSTTVSGNMAVTVRDRGTVRMVGGTLDGDTGADVDGEAALRLESVMFEGKGAVVKARGGRVELSQMTISRRGSESDSLVWAGGEANVRLDGGSLAAKTVLELSADSQTTVRGTSISGARTAYRVADRATLRLEDVELEGGRKVDGERASVEVQP